MSTNQPAIADGNTIPSHYPQGIQWDIAIPHIDLARTIDEAVVKFSNHPATHFMGKTMTYHELGDMISRAAKGLQDMGVKPGDKVGLYMPNTPYYPIMFFAALKIGATVVNYSPLYTKDELRTQIKDSGTDIIVALDLVDFQRKSTELLQEGVLRNVITCPMSHMLPFIKSMLFSIFRSDTVMYETTGGKNILFDALTNNDGIYRSVVIDPEELAVLQYTGGTTGTPKGAALTHFNLVSNAYQIQQFFLSTPEKPDEPGLMKEGHERVLAALPYYHVFGMMIAMIASLGMGAELDLIPNPRDIPTVIEALDNRKPALFPAVPRLLQALYEHKNISSADLTSLRAVISGGAALPANVRDAFEAASSPGVIMQGYGMSEASPVIASNPPYGLNKSDTVGLPYPRTEVKIANPDDSSQIRNIGEVGEICVRGPQVMQGYYNKPEETGKVMKDGWFLTGDLGYLDEDMYLHVVDRKKRMLIVNGENVYPSEVEKVIGNHPDVAECVVIGLPDPRSGEAAKAIIRFKPDVVVPPTVEEMREFLGAHLNRLAVPRHITYTTEELIKTPKGTPDWKKIEDQEREQLRLAEIKPASQQPNPFNAGTLSGDPKGISPSHLSL